MDVNYHEIAIDAAIRAGKEILRVYNSPDANFSVTKKSDRSPVTTADKNSHQIIVRSLQQTGLPVLSEEGQHSDFTERKNWESYWLVDPLDGTKEFLKRNGDFTVNIALVNDGKPVIGIIYVPVTETLYYGSYGVGSFKIDGISSQITVKEIQEKGIKLPCFRNEKKYVVACSRSHLNMKTRRYVRSLKKIHPEIEFVSRGSSIKICLVAEGLADEYPRFGPTMEWDTAAGQIIVNEAGKKLWLTDFSEELSYNKENLLNPHFIAK